MLFSTLRDKTAVGLNTLVPAVASTLGSTNDKVGGCRSRCPPCQCQLTRFTQFPTLQVRQASAQAADSLVASVEPALLVQNLSHCVSNGGVRGKLLLVYKLEAVIDAVYPSKPQLVVRYALPAALAIANDGKGGSEVKTAANQLLLALSRNMGQALVDHAATLPAALQQRVLDVIGTGAAAAGGAGAYRQPSPQRPSQLSRAPSNGASSAYHW